MQLVALFIELATAEPKPRAAIAMAAPTIARISAYSAAAAPESSFNILMNFVIFNPLCSQGELQSRGPQRITGRSYHDRANAE